MTTNAPAIPAAPSSCASRTQEKTAKNAPVTVPVTVSGLVISLSGDAPLRQQAIDAIDAHGALTVGEQQQDWVSVVLESTTPKQTHRWLDALPGVGYVDVVFVSVDSDNSPQPQPCSSSRQTH